MPRSSQSRFDYYNRNPELALIHSSRNRAVRNGIKFNLEVEDIHIPKRCPILGIKLKRTRGRHGDKSPSLDRVNPRKGYVKGNVRVISWAANRIKGKLKPKTIKALYHYITAE